MMDSKGKVIVNGMVRGTQACKAEVVEVSRAYNSLLADEVHMFFHDLAQAAFKVVNTQHLLDPMTDSNTVYFVHMPQLPGVKKQDAIKMLLAESIGVGTVEFVQMNKVLKSLQQKVDYVVAFKESISSVQSSEPIMQIAAQEEAFA